MRIIREEVCTKHETRKNAPNLKIEQIYPSNWRKQFGQTRNKNFSF